MLMHAADERGMEQWSAPQQQPNAAAAVAAAQLIQCKPVCALLHPEPQQAHAAHSWEYRCSCDHDRCQRIGIGRMRLFRFARHTYQQPIGRWEVGKSRWKRCGFTGLSIRAGPIKPRAWQPPASPPAPQRRRRCDEKGASKASAQAGGVGC